LAPLTVGGRGGDEPPPSFWAFASVNPEGTYIRKKDGEDLSMLMFRENDVRSLPFEFEVGCTNTNLAVVGLRIDATTTGTVEAIVVVHENEYELGKGAEVAITLAPEFVKPGATHIVRFQMVSQGASLICLRKLEIYCAPASECVVVEEMIERSPVQSVSDLPELCDFDDSLIDTRNNNAKFALLRKVAMAFGGCEATEEQMHELLDILYSDPLLSVLARRMIVRLTNPRSQIGIWWGKTLAHQAVHHELMSILWRDFSLLPRDARRLAEERVWRTLQDKDVSWGVAALFAAMA
jgi:hypothetical protein